MYLPPGHPIIAIRNNRNQNGRRVGKKIYLIGLFKCQTGKIRAKVMGIDYTSLKYGSTSCRNLTFSFDYFLFFFSLF